MIKGVTSDSREVEKDFAFVAVKGLNHDGHDYIKDAWKNGASIIYGEKPSEEFKKIGINYVKVADSRKKLGELAAEFYGNPSEKLKVIGITGTKGKTTTAHIIHHILTSLGEKAGLVSSISYPGLHVTSPDIVTLNKLLKNMVDEGYKYAVIEVSSHGIDQGRIDGVNFEIGVLTNIAPEHLDYHKTFKEYKRVKMSFVNSAKIKVISPKMTDLNILTGDFNNINAETAVQVVEKLGFNRERAIKTLSSFKLPEGRMEEIPNNLGIKVFIDFAHTPNSLEASLKYLRTITKGRLISIFGCASERDRRKRSKMGRISTDLADLSVFTTEDSRSENIFSILRMMQKKADPQKYVSIPERSEAISYALKIAEKGDTVAFFGKGHEKSMAYFGFEHPWSDKQIIEAQLSGSKDISAIIMAAGKGTRMHSYHPKVLREICGRPMLAYLLELLRKVGIKDIVAVVSFRKNEIMRRFPYSIDYAYQKNPKGGTGDAVKSGLTKIRGNAKYVLAFYGDDSAFFKPETTKSIIEDHIKKNATISFASVDINNPFGLGRVLRNRNGDVIDIIEEKEANEEEKKIKEVNCGHFVFDRGWLEKNINNIRTSTTGEVYIVDLIKMAIAEGKKINAFKLKNNDEWHGINTPEQLQEAEEKMKKRLLSERFE